MNGLCCGIVILLYYLFNCLLFCGSYFKEIYDKYKFIERENRNLEEVPLDDSHIEIVL